MTVAFGLLNSPAMRAMVETAVEIDVRTDRCRAIGLVVDLDVLADMATRQLRYPNGDYMLLALDHAYAVGASGDRSERLPRGFWWNEVHRRDDPERSDLRSLDSYYRAATAEGGE